MGRALTPEDLTYYSFRHSQGDLPGQIIFLHLVERTSGIAPEFELTQAATMRYVRFLGASDKANVHKNVIEIPLPHEYISSVYKEIGSLAKRYDEHSKMCSRSVEYELSSFTDGLLLKENKYLEPYNPWMTPQMFYNFDNRYARMKSRVESGRASFLLHYGRDGNSTGYEAFDTVYRQAWDIAQKDERERGLAGKIAVLEQNVTAAEQHFLGRTILGNPELVLDTASL